MKHRLKASTESRFETIQLKLPRESTTRKTTHACVIKPLGQTPVLFSEDHAWIDNSQIPRAELSQFNEIENSFANEATGMGRAHCIWRVRQKNPSFSFSLLQYFFEILTMTHQSGKLYASAY